MPNIRSAAKRMRADARLHAHNLAIRSELKTLLRKFRESIQAGKPAEELKKAYSLVMKRLDMAAKRKIFHKKSASRKKARLARELQKKLVR